MLLNHAQIHRPRVASILSAAEAAARAIPPAFPLETTVAVNPFLGQTGEGLAAATARLARVAGARLTRPRAEYAVAVSSGEIRDDDLHAALDACLSRLKPSNLGLLKASLLRESPAPQALPTIADLVTRTTGRDWRAVLTQAFGLWAAGHFDRGQALWSPAPGRGAFEAWRDWATHDRAPEIAGLVGFRAHVGEGPSTAEGAILRASDRLGISLEAAESVFHRLLMDLGGWAQHARWLLWEAELKGTTSAAITDLLAVRLTWEEALIAHYPEVVRDWAQTVRAHAAPVEPSREQIIDAILQEAAERAYQRRLEGALTSREALANRPLLQAAFCIDVRSEVFRRALESQDPGIETIGFAGFFGLPLAHQAHGSDQVQAHLPVLLRPALTSSSHLEPTAEHVARISARAVRAWGRFRQAAVSSFAFVEAAGPTYGWKLVQDALGLKSPGLVPEPEPRIVGGMTAEAKSATAAAVLKAMSLTKGHARLVLLIGHGAQVTNNPHGSAYQCGACGGHNGEISARLLAGLLNDPETRAGLPALGIELPEDTLFVAGLHDTTTDDVTLYQNAPVPGHEADLAQARDWLHRAGVAARAERILRLPGATAANIAARARNWAEVRPEWGLAGCAAFIAASRHLTAGSDLQGRAFLHSYEWRTDPSFSTLELILTAPVVVASWISLQYYGSSVAPAVFGGGNKLIHNVVGGIGVVQGNGGMLCPGLPLQAVDNGEDRAHEPLRLSVLIEAPKDAILEVLARQDAVRALFDNGWMHLFALEEGRISARYRQGLRWESDTDLRRAA